MTDKHHESLAIRLKSADRSAADELVDLYYDQIYNYLRRMGFGNAGSEDMTQEVFLKAWQHIAQLRNDHMLKPWLYRIATNVSRSQLRKKNKTEALNQDELTAENNQSWENVEDKQLYLKLKKEINDLPVKLKQVILLHYMQHLTISETADAICISEGTVKSRIGRGLKKLRKKMELKNGKYNE